MHAACVCDLGVEMCSNDGGDVRVLIFVWWQENGPPGHHFPQAVTGEAPEVVFSPNQKIFAGGDHVFHLNSTPEQFTYVRHTAGLQSHSDIIFHNLPALTFRSSSSGARLKTKSASA